MLWSQGRPRPADSWRSLRDAASPVGSGDKPLLPPEVATAVGARGRFRDRNGDRPDSDGPPIEGGHARARAGRPRRDPRRKWVSCNSKQWGLSLRDVEGLDDSYQSRGEADDTASESSPTLVGIFTVLLL